MFLSFRKNQPTEQQTEKSLIPSAFPLQHYKTLSKLWTLPLRKWNLIEGNDFLTLLAILVVILALANTIDAFRLMSHQVLVLSQACLWVLQRSLSSLLTAELRSGFSTSSVQSTTKLTVAQIMNSLLPNSDLKKVGKTTRPFRYDLNQIPYNYIVEVRNRFKGLDLIECLMNYGWRFVTVYRR